MKNKPLFFRSGRLKCATIILLSIFILQPNHIFSQSKKDKILALTFSFDSISQILERERNEKNSLTKELSQKKSEFERQIEDSRKTIADQKKQIESKTSLNNQLEQSVKEKIIENRDLLQVSKLQLDSIIRLNATINSQQSPSEYLEVPYIPTRDRFDNLSSRRKILIDKSPLTLYPFELFDIMLFEEASSGLTNGLNFIIPETGENVFFDDFNNKIGFKDNDFISNEDGELVWAKSEVSIYLKCDCENENLIRKIVKGKRYKVIYSYKSDSELYRFPFATESNEGFYIVDIIEMNEKFEREKVE
jgi:hypothetical protein